jgi:hypothetical protein
MWKVTLLAWPLLLAPAVSEAESAHCDVTTTVRATSPVDPNADAVGPTGWYRNADKSIWVAIAGHGWTEGANKTYWVRPAGSDLIVTGHLRDDRDTVLQTEIPCCYPTGFQIVGMIFPVAGCWEVEATSGDAALRFATLVGQRENPHRE